MNEQCGDNRFELIKKYKDKLIESTNIEASPEEMLVLDDILFRMWQMGWLDSLEALENYKKIKALMDKYNIKNVDELEHIIMNDATGEEAFREYFEANVMPYRNIEKELGINLLTLFKALKNGIWVKYSSSIIEHKTWYVHLLDNYVGWKENSGSLYDHDRVEDRRLKDYGNTWALTKEELL